jgi:hypothetical protein
MAKDQFTPFAVVLHLNLTRGEGGTLHQIRSLMSEIKSF